MARRSRDDDLAYGEYNPGRDDEEGERGMIGDMGRRLFGGRKDVSTVPTTNANAVIVHLNLAVDCFKWVRGRSKKS